MNTWTLLVAKIGLGWACILAVYVAVVLWFLGDLFYSIGQHLYWRLVIRRRLKAIRKGQRHEF